MLSVIVHHKSVENQFLQKLVPIVHGVNAAVGLQLTNNFLVYQRKIRSSLSKHNQNYTRLNGIWAIPIISSILFLGALGLSQDVFASDGSVQKLQKIAEGVGGFTGDLDSGDFLTPVAGIGDLNNDGVNDLVVGAPSDDDDEGNSGAVYILFMKDDGTVSSFQKITQGVGGFTGDLTATDYFGFSVAGLGDLNGDGVEDIAVGAVGDDDAGAQAGAIWILFLDSDGTVKDSDTDGTKITEGVGGFTGDLDAEDRFGSSVANIGDLDNDGVTDIVVGAPRDDDGGAASDRGAVWVLFLDADGTVDDGNTDGTKISDIAGDFTGTLDNSDHFGASVTGIGDLDGDNIEDIAVGAAEDDDVSNNGGAVWILFLDADGSVDNTNTDGTKITEGVGGFTGDLDDSDRFGETVTRAGDLNGDGVVDIAVGAAGDDDAGSRAGAVWVVFLDNDGTAADSDTDGVKITEGAGGFTGDLDGNDDFGGGLAFSIQQGGTIGIADIDCDNTEDLIVGAPGDDDGNAGGAIYVLFMGPGGSCASAATTSSGDGDSSAPTLGTSATGQRLIENGFMYNGNPVDVENFKTHYPLIRTPVGEPNTLDLKVLENQGVNQILFVSVHFGVPQIRAQGEAIVTYYPGVDVMKIHDPNNLLGDVNFELSPVKCKANDDKESCVKFSLDHTFNEAPIHDIVRVTLADKTRNHSDVFFNDGVEVFGDSLNPVNTAQIAAQGKDKGLLQLTQTDRAQEIWTDQYDNTWSKNSMGNFIPQPLNEFAHPDDNPVPGNGYKRQHMHFDTYKKGQELYAKQIWNGVLIQSELPESFETPVYGAILESENPALRINDIALQKDILKQIERANQKLNAPEQSLEDYGIFVKIIHDPIMITDEILFAKDFSGFKDKKLSEIENALKLHEQKITKKN